MPVQSLVPGASFCLLPLSCLPSRHYCHLLRLGPCGCGHVSQHGLVFCDLGQDQTTPKRKRWSETVNKRMWTISTDWNVRSRCSFCHQHSQLEFFIRRYSSPRMTADARHPTRLRSTVEVQVCETPLWLRLLLPANAYLAFHLQILLLSAFHSAYAPPV